jgi:hypothetical protein
MNTERGSTSRSWTMDPSRMEGLSHNKIKRRENLPVLEFWEEIWPPRSVDSTS